jgi:hypothetical protein
MSLTRGVAAFRRNTGSRPDWPTAVAFRRNTVTSPRNPDACRTLAARPRLFRPARRSGTTRPPWLASRRAVPLQAMALEAIERQPLSPHNRLLFPVERGRLPPTYTTPRPPLEAGTARGRDRASAQGLRSPTHLHHRRPPCRHLHLRPLPLHGRQPDDDRPPLRQPRPRRTRTRDPPPPTTERRTTSTVDAGGRCVDVDAGNPRQPRQQKHPLSWQEREAL